MTDKSLLGLLNDPDYQPQPVQPLSNGDLSSDEFNAFIERAVREDSQVKYDREMADWFRGVIDRTCAPELIELAAKRPRTRATYLNETKRFVEWCRGWGVSPLPALPAIVAAYLLQMVSEGASQERLRKVVAAIGHAHTLKDYSDPTEDAYPRAVLRASRRHKEIRNDEKQNGKAH